MPEPEYLYVNVSSKAGVYFATANKVSAYSTTSALVAVGKLITKMGIKLPVEKPFAWTKKETTLPGREVWRIEIEKSEVKQ
jgi:hypothetical protein